MRRIVLPVDAVPINNINVRKGGREAHIQGEGERELHNGAHTGRC